MSSARFHADSVINFFVLVKEIFLCTLLRDELTLDSNKYEAEANYAMLGQWLWL